MRLVQHGIRKVSGTQGMLSVQGSQEHDFANGTELNFD